MDFVGLEEKKIKASEQKEPSLFAYYFTIETVNRSEGNPYGLMLTNLEPISYEKYISLYKKN